MKEIYRIDDVDKRKLSYLYRASGIEKRYSAIPDYSRQKEDWAFYDPWMKEPMPSLEKRLECYEKEALPISVSAINDCIKGFASTVDITHLITVSCTGMSAPGLDLKIVETMGMRNTIFRTSVNFMGCYAAIHALKLAKMIGDNDPTAKIVIVATELCTLHFQNEFTPDNVSSSLLFADGCAAVLLQHTQHEKGLLLDNFFSTIATNGKNDMSWNISSRGFLMTLSSYIPELIEADIDGFLQNAFLHFQLQKKDITHWCIHPGGKRILQVIRKKVNLDEEDLCYSKKILSNYGNMSSPTILFVLKEMMHHLKKNDKILGIAFGPGLTMETVLFQQR